MAIDISRYVQRFRTSPIYIRSKITTKSPMGAVTAGYGGETELLAHLMPGGGALEQREYGAKAEDMVFAFVDPNAPVNAGDFVRVYAAAGADPDYRVAAPPHRKHSYWRIDLELI